MFDQAFPEGDLAGHRAYHEARIEAARAEEEFWRVSKETLKKGVTSPSGSSGSSPPWPCSAWPSSWACRWPAWCRAKVP